MHTDDSMQSTGAWDVVRRIKMPALSQAVDAAAVAGAIGELPGVHKVTTDLDKSQIIVDYDASQSSYREIAQTLKNAGLAPSRSWWVRIKASWYQYTDENIRENAKKPPPACCNKPPR